MRDPRQHRKVTYSLDEVFPPAWRAVLAGADFFVDLARLTRSGVEPVSPLRVCLARFRRAIADLTEEIVLPSSSLGWPLGRVHW